MQVSDRARNDLPGLPVLLLERSGASAQCRHICIEIEEKAAAAARIRACARGEPLPGGAQ